MTTVLALVCLSLALGIILGIFLGIRCGQGFLGFCARMKRFIRKTNRRLWKWFSTARYTQIMETGHSFETLYKKGKFYVIPLLVETKDMEETNSKKEENESVALLLSEFLTDQAAQYKVKDIVRSILQESTKQNDPPSFLLHNTRLNMQENIILVLSRKLGVIVMMVKAVEDVKKLQSMDEAVRQLLEAGKEVRERLEGLVKPGAVTAVLALPNLPWSNMEDVRQHLKPLRSHPDVDVLLGQEKDNFMQWTEELTSRPDSDVWNFRSPGVDSADTAYKKAASSFLTLTGCSPPGESARQPAAEKCWLLTPAQLQVRDSTARLLHIWGVPGSGKTSLLIQKAGEWLAEGKTVILAVGRKFYDIRLAYMDKAVRCGQDEETCKRIRVCRTYQEMQRAFKELKGLYSHEKTSVIIDGLRETYMFRNMVSIVESGKVEYIWSTCGDSLKNLDAEEWRKASQLGWEDAALPDCIRCTENTVELLNLLVQGSPDHTHISACSLPRTPVIPAWRVVDHYLHPQHTHTTSHCPQCRKEMSAALPSPDWKDWIALHTGNPEFIQLESLCGVLQNMGVSSHFEIGGYLRSHPVSASGDSFHRSPTTDFARFRELVTTGLDETGEPTVHLLPCTDFRGMEKEGVIVLHWDERDIDPDYQSQGKRNAREKEHRDQWFSAVSRSKGQVILLLLTPSPVRTLLNLPEPVLPQGSNHRGSWQQPARTAGNTGGGPREGPEHLRESQAAKQPAGTHRQLSSPV